MQLLTKNKLLSASVELETPASGRVGRTYDEPILTALISTLAQIDLLRRCFAYVVCHIPLCFSIDCTGHHTLCIS